MKNLLNYIYDIDIINIEKISDDYLLKTTSYNYILKKIMNILYIS